MFNSFSKGKVTPFRTVVVVSISTRYIYINIKCETIKLSILAVGVQIHVKLSNHLKHGTWPTSLFPTLRYNKIPNRLTILAPYRK